MGDNNLPNKNAVSDELAELIERKIRENNALLKLIGKLNTGKVKDYEASKVNVIKEKL